MCTIIKMNYLGAHHALEVKSTKAKDVYKAMVRKSKEVKKGFRGQLMWKDAVGDFMAITSSDNMAAALQNFGTGDTLYIYMQDTPPEPQNVTLFGRLATAALGGAAVATGAGIVKDLFSDA